MRNFRILGIALAFSCSLTVMHQSHAYADVRAGETRKGSHQTRLEATNITPVVFSSFHVVNGDNGFDHLFVCTASVPSIFVEFRFPYAASGNMGSNAPGKTVWARCNSPGRNYLS